MMMVGGRCQYWWLRAVELSIFITAHEDDTMVLIKTSPIKHEWQVALKQKTPLPVYLWVAITISSLFSNRRILHFPIQVCEQNEEINLSSNQQITKNCRCTRKVSFTSSFTSTPFTHSLPNHIQFYQLLSSYVSTSLLSICASSPSGNPETTERSKKEEEILIPCLSIDYHHHHQC